MTSSEGKSLIGISPPAGEVTEVGGKSQTRPFLAGLPADPPRPGCYKSGAKPPPSFFTEVIRRRAKPLYRHPALYKIGTSPGKYSSVEDGSITDGDDHEGVGGHALLRKAARDEGGVGGWADVASGEAKKGLKRSRVLPDAETDSEHGPSRQRQRIEEEGGRGEQDEEGEEGLEQRSLKTSLGRLAHRLHHTSEILTAQIPHENTTWMQNIRTTLSEEWESRLESLLTDIQQFERSGTTPTWPRNPKEQAASKHTLGYQLGSTRRLEANQSE